MHFWMIPLQENPITFLQNLCVYLRKMLLEHFSALYEALPKWINPLQESKTLITFLGQKQIFKNDKLSTDVLRADVWHATVESWPEHLWRLRFLGQWSAFLFENLDELLGKYVCSGKNEMLRVHMFFQVTKKWDCLQYCDLNCFYFQRRNKMQSRYHANTHFNTAVSPSFHK